MFGDLINWLVAKPKSSRRSDKTNDVFGELVRHLLPPVPKDTRVVVRSGAAECSHVLHRVSSPDPDYAPSRHFRSGRYDHEVPDTAADVFRWRCEKCGRLEEETRYSLI